MTGLLLSASVGTAIIGRLGDMYGKERLLFWTLLMLAAGTVLSAVSNSLAVVIAGRVVQGAALCTWRYVPESPIRSPGRVNWGAAVLMSVGMCCVLIAITQTTVWGWAMRGR